MRRNWIIGGVAALAGALIAAWAAAPIVTAQQLIQAARRGDAAGVERRVDFPALRESLKRELEDELIARLRRDPRIADSGLGGLAMMLGPQLVDGAVDAVVTPDGVAQMVATAQAPDPQGRTEADSGVRDEGPDLHQSWGYRGLNAFAVTLTDRDRPDRRLALILERRGVLTWKLAAVDLSVPA